MDIFKSKRFWAAIVTIIVTIFNSFGLDIPEDTLNNVVMIVASWIIGDSLRFFPAKTASLVVEDVEA